MKTKDIIAALFFLAVSVVIFLPMFISDKLFSWLDFTYYFLPFRQLTAEIVKSGVVPLWNPYIYCGNPLMANMQSAVFYPLNILYYVLPFIIALKIQTLLAFFIAAFSMYAFIRSYNTGRAASALGASIFAFGFYLTVRAVEMADLHVIIWIPAVLLLARRHAILNRLHDMFLLILCLSMSFLGGHPQVFSYVFILFTGFYFFEAFNIGKKMTGMLKNYAVISGLFLMSVLLQLLPTAEFALFSKRASEGVGANVHLSTFSGMEQALTFFFPFLSGMFGRQSGFLNWMGMIDIGAPAIMLFIAGIFVIKHSRQKIFIFSIFAAGVFIAFAGNFEAYRLLLNVFPALGSVEYVSKINIMCLVSVCLICAFAFDGLLINNERHGKTTKLFFVLSALIFLISAAVFFLRIPVCEFLQRVVYKEKSYLHARSPLDEFGPVVKNFTVYAAFLFFSAALLFYRSLSGKTGRTAGYAVFTLAFLALFSYHTAGYDFYADSKVFFEDTENTALLKKEMNTTISRLLAPYSSNRFDYRVVTGSNEASVYYIRESLFPNVPMQERMFNADGFDSLEISSFYELKKRIQGLDLPWENPAFSLFSAEYIVSQAELKVGYVKRLSKGFSNVYRYEKAMPLVYFVAGGNKIVFTNDKNQVLDGITSKAFDPNKELYLEEGAKSVFESMTPGTSAAKITFALDNVNTFSIDAITGSDGVIVITDNYYPGWEAYINGKKAKIYRANHTFKAIAVKKGNNRIKLIFNPGIFKITALFSILTLFFVFLCFYFKLMKQRTYTQKVS